MKRISIRVMPLVLLWLFVSALNACCAEDLFALTDTVNSGDKSVSLTMSTDLTEIRANVFSNGEALANQVESQDDQVVLTLRRELQEGENLLIVLKGTDLKQNEVSGKYAVTVSSKQRSKLRILREKVDQMWEKWLAVYNWTEKTHQVCLPGVWRDVPFITWADEAPEITVREKDGRTCICVYDEDLTGWRVQTGSGMPIEYKDCEWDAALGAYVCDGSFDSVCLCSDMGQDRIGISIAYERSSDFLASHPVLEWNLETDEHVEGFACYAWGNIRSFDGGMYCVVDDDLKIYGEYDSQRGLTGWYDLYYDLAYDAEGNLTSGNEPEGYTVPVTH